MSLTNKEMMKTCSYARPDHIISTPGGHKKSTKKKKADLQKSI